MKSLLYGDNSPFTQPPLCGPCRLEVPVTINKNGRIYRFMLRDKVVVEDPMIVMVKAEAFAIAQGEPYSGRPTPRSIRDFLIRSNVVI